MASKDIQIVDPSVRSTREMSGVLPHWQTMDDLRIGVINNTKPNFDRLIKFLGQHLRTSHATQPLVVRHKAGPTMAAPTEVYESFSGFDIVLVGSGD